MHQCNGMVSGSVSRAENLPTRSTVCFLYSRRPRSRVSNAAVAPPPRSPEKKKKTSTHNNNAKMSNSDSSIHEVHLLLSRAATLPHDLQICFSLVDSDGTSTPALPVPFPSPLPPLSAFSAAWCGQRFSASSHAISPENGSPP